MRKIILFLLLPCLAACAVTMQPSGTRELAPPPPLPATADRVELASLRHYATSDQTVIVDGWVVNPHADRVAWHVRVELELRLPDGESVRGHDIIGRIAARSHEPFRCVFSRPDLAARAGELQVSGHVALATTR